MAGHKSVMFGGGQTTLLPEGGRPARERPLLEALIRADQLSTSCRNLRLALPVNILLGLASLLVAGRAGHGMLAGVWFTASLAVNAGRFLLCHAPLAGPGGVPPTPDAVDRRLRLTWMGALASGLVWATVSSLCGWYAEPETLFFLTVTCGVTAGAVTHGMAFARVPIAFITPPLLSTSAVLLANGGFDRVCLALTVLLYLAALVRSAVGTEAGFREASRLKHEATDLARSLQVAHAHSLETADEMRHRAAHDALTGLLNRSGLVGHADAIPDLGRSHCLLMLDLDGFKSVNDAFGHEVGDRVLVEVARRIRAEVPAGSVTARLGGDEFAVLYDPVASGTEPAAVAGRLIRSISARMEGCDAGRLGVSIGMCRLDGPRIDAALIGADEALYAAKASGRARFRLFDDDLRVRRNVRLDVERDLPAALDAHALDLHFQPILGDGGRAVAGFEALLRWTHPRHGAVAPPDIVSIAALTGLAEPLLRFVLDGACAMATRVGPLHGDGPRVSVNVSPRELAQLPVAELVLERLQVHGLPPSVLGIEITEEAAIDFGAVRTKLAALRAVGVALAIDDFGVGYASLASIRHLGADRVKIDRSFVTGLSHSPEDRTLVGAVLNLGRSMRFAVVAEGVETEDDLRALRELGCGLMQGYGLGRPMPAEAVLAWLARTRSAAAA